MNNRNDSNPSNMVQLLPSAGNPRAYANWYQFAQLYDFLQLCPAAQVQKKGQPGQDVYDFGKRVI